MFGKWLMTACIFALSAQGLNAQTDNGEQECPADIEQGLYNLAMGIELGSSEYNPDTILGQLLTVGEICEGRPVALAQAANLALQMSQYSPNASVSLTIFDRVMEILEKSGKATDSGSNSISIPLSDGTSTTIYAGTFGARTMRSLASNYLAFAQDTQFRSIHFLPDEPMTSCPYGEHGQYLAESEVEGYVDYWYDSNKEAALSDMKKRTQSLLSVCSEANTEIEQQFASLLIEEAVVNKTSDPDLVTANIAIALPIVEQLLVDYDKGYYFDTASRLHQKMKDNGFIAD